MNYIEMIYDCIIQIASGLEFAHNNELIHGAVDLSNIIVCESENH